MSCRQTYVVRRFRHTTAYDPTPLAPGEWGGLFKVLILSSLESERQRGLRSNGPVRSRNRPIVGLTQECNGAVPQTAHPTPNLPPVLTFLVIRNITPPFARLRWDRHITCNRASASAGGNAQRSAPPVIEMPMCRFPSGRPLAARGPPGPTRAHIGSNTRPVVRSALASTSRPTEWRDRNTRGRRSRPAGVPPARFRRWSSPGRYAAATRGVAPRAQRSVSRSAAGRSAPAVGAVHDRLRTSPKGVRVGGARLGAAW